VNDSLRAFDFDFLAYTIQVYRPPLLDPGHPQTRFHSQVNQLGQLAAYIALDLKEASQPKVEQAQLRLESLDQWHRSLPLPMQLNWLTLRDQDTVPWYTKRSLLQVHMLFLGLFTEPYRMLLVDLGRSRLSDSSGALENPALMEEIEKQCILGARQCARVASLLQVDDLIRSHCWVAV
jgi:hypothetical protein